MAEPEFSRVVSIARLSAAGNIHDIAANKAECQALAARFDLVALDHLAAHIVLIREPGGGVRLDGQIEAAVTQSCVATLAPVPSVIADRFALVFRPGLDDAEADRLTFETEEDVTFEPLAGDQIDIGEVAAQQLSLVMDPYPRSAAAIAALPGADEAIERARPLAGLASLVRPS
jgi:uncharacterized metal-binding protein YceD (DUF177 family)